MLFTLLSKQTAPRKTCLMTTAEAAKIGAISPTGFKDPLAPLKDKESGDMANRTIDFFTVRFIGFCSLMCLCSRLSSQMG